MPLKNKLLVQKINLNSLIMKKLLFYFLLIPILASAQNFTSWTGSGNWSNSGNWSAGTGYGQLQFLGSGSTSVTADAAMSQWRLFFNNGVSYTISGSGALSLFDFGGNPSWVLSDASVNQNLNFPLLFADTGARYAWITTRAAGPLTFGGNVSVTGGSILALRLAGSNTAGTITLNGTLTSGRPLDIGKDNVDATQANTRVFLNGVNSSFTGVTTIYGGTLTVPLNSALGTNTVTLGNGTTTTTLAFTDNTTRSQGTIIADGSTAGVVDIASGKTFELTGVLSQTGSNQATKIGKSGAGTLTLTGTATYSGQIQIGQGNVILNNNSAIGTNTSTSNRGVDLGLNVGDVSQANNVSLLANNAITVGQSIYVSANTSSATRTIGLNGSGTANFTNEIYTDGDLTLNAGSGTLSISGNIVSPVNNKGLFITSGTVNLVGTDASTGAITLNGGNLTLGNDNRIADTAPIVLTSGTFSTNGKSDSVGTLNLNGTGTIALLAATNHTLTFANSSSVGWSGTTLTITSWGGTAGQTNASGGKIMVGVGGLTLAQRQKIVFSGYAGTPIILGSGELVPPGPSLAITSGSLTHGTSCVGTAVSSITYTITNTGGTAAGVTVISNNPEFVVSNLSSTTIAGAGGTVTYQVTFTPSAGGTRNANITINTTTPNSNAPVISALSGTGNPLPTASVSGTTAVCRNAASPLTTFTGAAGTAPYTFTYNINGGTNTTVTTVAGNSVTVAASTGTAGTYIYNLVSVQDSSTTTCSNTQSGSATITVNPLPTASVSGTVVVCQNASAPLVTFTGAAGTTPYTFTYNINGGTNTTVTTVSGNSVTVAAATGTPGTSVYNLVSVQDSSTTACSNAQSGSATITVNPLPTATISGTTTVCRNSSAPSVTFTGAAGTAPYTFTYNINGGANTTVTTVAGNSVTVAASTATAGTFVYNLVSVQDSSTTTCSNAQSGSATITVDNGTTYYADSDADGFGDASNSIVSCSGQPDGYVTNNTDCAPANTAAWRLGDFYTDADNDGYNNGAPTTSLCYGATTPSGYTPTNIGTDCDDSASEVNTNHVEIPANSIDDNCDGTVDEAAPTTSLIAAQCGATLGNINNQIYASQVPVAEGYRFEVTNGANIRTYDSATNSFSLLNLTGGAAYATTYTIRVAVKTGGFWRSYFTACTVTTPSTPETTQVVATQCGSTLALMATTIYANQVTAASQYRFEVTNGANVRTYDTAFNRFSLTNLSGTNTFATTYIVRVALMINAVWQPYGAACSITTPATPGYSNITSPSCGSTISNTWATIYASPIAGAQGYRFQVTNGAQTRFYDSAVPRFALRNLTGTILPSTAYTIRVAVLYNSVYQPFGSSCVINTAAAITRETATAVDAFQVKASPNPFASTFRLEMNTSSEQQVDVKVYDMIGKLVESRQIGVAQFGSLEVGDRYPSGVYNIIVTQGENVKTLRVIKR
jgi:autotransporter-associated beta strand protein